MSPSSDAVISSLSIVFNKGSGPKKNIQDMCSSIHTNANTNTDADANVNVNNVNANSNAGTSTSMDKREKVSCTGNE